MNDRNDTQVEQVPRTDRQAGAEPLPNYGVGPGPTAANTGPQAGPAQNMGYGYNQPGFGYNQPGYGYPLAGNHEQIVLASGANLLLGLWLIAAPFVLTYTAANARGNDVIFGIIIATIAAVRVFGAYRSAWLSWINVVLGAWLIIAPFVLGYGGHTHPMWNDVIVGILVAAFGVWSALATHGTFNRNT